MNSEKKLISAYCDDVLGTKDGIELAALITAGEIRASEAIEAAIARAQKVNPALNAIGTETFEQARNQHKMPASGLLAGVPSFIKDNEKIGYGVALLRFLDREKKQVLGIGKTAVIDRVLQPAE